MTRRFFSMNAFILPAKTIPVRHHSLYESALIEIDGIALKTVSIFLLHSNNSFGAYPRKVCNLKRDIHSNLHSVCKLQHFSNFCTSTNRLERALFCQLENVLGIARAAAFSRSGASSLPLDPKIQASHTCQSAACLDW
jgi:hypothetical protein